MTPSGNRSGNLPAVLINCDDLGMYPTINDAVVEILAGGIVKSASLMAVGNFFEDAVQKLAREGIREIGVHLTLGSEYTSLPVRPLSEATTVPSLVGGDGAFHPDIRAIRERLDTAEVRRELCLQVNR
ncbi:MAG: ChbG/HpnK family deacetylase, partial [bacterium]|nr:ChbG/HpnK family deacetylase [bacterium]